MSKLKMVFACGGTSGHVNPALAIAKSYQERHPEVEILFCGLETGIEAKLVKKAGFQFQAIHAAPLPRRLNRKFFSALATYRRGRSESLEILRNFAADVVVGTGGYVCAPVLSAAKRLKIPRLIHEQNVFSGISNRLLGRGAELVCISFEKSRSSFKRAKRVLLTGNPVSPDLFDMKKEEARKSLGIALKPGEKLVLATGGSLGARQINRAVTAWAKQREEKGNPDQIRIIIAAGQRLYEEASSEAAGISILEVKDFLYNMPLHMAAADFIISRAGALSCAEIAALSKAALFVPYPYAVEDHQSYNAQIFVDAGAGLMCRDENLNVEYLARELESLLNQSERLDTMARQASTLAKRDALEKIVDGLETLV
ncbi:MAG: undecaprenyldiphospho-muramoylpentapeptide beta-N-acetylglucosaminyltransferase [Eubacteriales bacterium]|nr:undecaprenyldiphospho-muramoylpentapeptide beta-N-acetylglucosaminyltransferase [Eubacteriales bacterium]